MGPPHREGPGRGVVPVWLPAAWAPRPGARLLAAWRAFDRRYRSLLPARTRPPYQCFGVPGTLAVAFGFSVRRAPPLFVLSFGVCRRVCRHRGAVGGSVGGSVAPGELSAVRSFLPARRAPPYQCFGVPGIPAVPLRFFRPPCPALSVLSFGRVSAASRGRRGFRSPCVASPHAARNRSKGFWACVELARSVVPVHPIDRCTCVANFTAGACARAPERLTPPLSDGG